MSNYNHSRIAYVSPVQISDNNAASRRILGNALTLREAGFDVLIGSGELSSTKTPYEFEGIPVHSLGERTAETHPTFVKHLIYFSMGKKTIQWLDALSPRPRAVILYSGYSPFFKRLIPWCRLNNVTLIFDAVEWYHPSQMPGGRLSLYRWNFELAMRYYCLRVGRIIVISKFLKQYFDKHRCQTVRIPPTLDTQKVEPNLQIGNDAIISIGYAGIPGRKDLFNSLLEALFQLNTATRRFKLYLAGMTSSQLLEFPAINRRGLREVPQFVHVLGKVNRSEAMSMIRRVDYSVLLRPPLRYAQAGFPTKVVESLSLGTPVICNLTSDLGEYIHDGIEGVVCENHYTKSLIECLQRLCSYSVEQRLRMRLAARRQAEKSFDYKKYINHILDFMYKIGAT